MCCAKGLLQADSGLCLHRGPPGKQQSSSWSRFAQGRSLQREFAAFIGAAALAVIPAVAGVTAQVIGATLALVSFVELAAVSGAVEIAFVVAKPGQSAWYSSSCWGALGAREDLKRLRTPLAP